MGFVGELITRIIVPRGLCLGPAFLETTLFGTRSTWYRTCKGSYEKVSGIWYRSIGMKIWCIRVCLVKPFLVVQQ